MLIDFLASLAVGVLVIGAFQAMLLLFSLHRKSGSPTISSRLLTYLLLSISGVLLHHAAFMSLPADFPFRYMGNGLAATLWFSIPPLYWLYVRSLVDAQATLLPSSSYYLFLPAAYHFISWLAEFGGWYLPWGKWLGDYAILHLYAWVGGYLVVGLWCTVSVSHLLAQPAKLASTAEEQVATESIGRVQRTATTDLNWLAVYTRWFTSALLFSGCVLIVLAFTNSYNGYFEFSLLAVFAAFTIGLAYRSMRYPDTSGRLAGRLYGAAAVDLRELPALHKKLEDYIQQERPYLNPDLRRSDLATATGISEHQLSQVFGRHLHTTFYTYINGYRLRAFEARLTDGSLNQLTMAGLAQACGFKSKTSLYRVFRKKHGTTPSEYLKERALKV